MGGLYNGQMLVGRFQRADLNSTGRIHCVEFNRHNSASRLVDPCPLQTATIVYMHGLSTFIDDFCGVWFLMSQPGGGGVESKN